MIQQTYEEFIQNILKTRGRFACGEEYHERHHIKPKCIGGTNDENNLIDLYAREHFEAHRLLALENPDSDGLTYSWWMMAHGKNQDRITHIVTAEEYEEARVALSRSKRGGSLSEETRNKISEAKMGEKNANYGKSCPEEIKKKISIANKGKHCISEEEKERLRQLNKGGNAPNARKVIRLCDNKIYLCAKDAAKENGINYKTFTRHCRQHKDFMYYDECVAIVQTNYTDIQLDKIDCLTG